MIAAPLRVLVAENQYLIAMEVERILLEALSCEVTIAPLAQLDEALARESFDVVVVEAVLAEALNAERSHMIKATGARPVFLSSYDYFPDASAVVAAHPLVGKPPQAEELAAEVRKAAHGIGPSDSKGLLDDR